eukprot:scaffold1066_cov421-Prasinococcus_capsulatus_cf.AAC.7
MWWGLFSGGQSRTKKGVLKEDRAACYQVRLSSSAHVLLASRLEAQRVRLRCPWGCRPETATTAVSTH